MSVGSGYEIDRNETFLNEIRRIANEQIVKAVSEIDSGSLDVHKKVHQQRGELQRKAFALGSLLFAETTDCFCKRIIRYWQTH